MHDERASDSGPFASNSLPTFYEHTLCAYARVCGGGMVEK